MPSVAIYVKTMIMKRFRDQHPPTSRPGERRFYSELLTLDAPQRPVRTKCDLAAPSTRS